MSSETGDSEASDVRLSNEAFQRLHDRAKQAIELQYGDAWQVHDHNKIKSVETPEWLHGESQASHEVCPWPNIDFVIEVIVDGVVKRPDEMRAVFIEEAGLDLFAAVWRGIQAGQIQERGPIADSALVLRDVLNPEWPGNSDWLPEPLATERTADNSDL